MFLAPRPSTEVYRGALRNDNVLLFHRKTFADAPPRHHRTMILVENGDGQLATASTTEVAVFARG